MSKLWTGKMVLFLICLLALAFSGICKVNAAEIDYSTAIRYIDNDGIVTRCFDKSKIGTNVRQDDTDYQHVRYDWGYGFENEVLADDFDRSNIVSQFLFYDETTGKDVYVASKYLKEDGSTTRTGWYQDVPTNVSDYKLLVYLNEDGYRVQGWQKIDGLWYHFKEGSGFLDVSTTVDGYRISAQGIAGDKP